MPGSAPDKTIINANVQEKSTGDFSVGIGFSTTDGAARRHRRPRAQSAGHAARISASTRSWRCATSSIDLSYTEPYFLDRNLAAGFDLFADNRDNTSFAGFSQFTLGGTLRAGYQITEPLRQTLNYTLRKDRIYNVSSRPPRPSSRRRPGRATPRPWARPCSTTSATTAWIRPRAITPRSAPTSPGSAATSAYLARLPSGGRLLPDSADYVLALTGQGGHILGIEQDVRIEDRFFVGGDNLRGFADGRHRAARQHLRRRARRQLYYAGLAVAGLSRWACRRSSASRGRVFSDFGTLFSIRPERPDDRRCRRQSASRPAPASRGNRRSDRSSSISAIPSSRSPSTSAILPRRLRHEVLDAALGAGRSLALWAAPGALPSSAHAQHRPAAAAVHRRRHDADPPRRRRRPRTSRRRSASRLTRYSQAKSRSRRTTCRSRCKTISSAQRTALAPEVFIAALAGLSAALRRARPRGAGEAPGTAAELQRRDDQGRERRAADRRRHRQGAQGQHRGREGGAPLHGRRARRDRRK